MRIVNCKVVVRKYTFSPFSYLYFTKLCSYLHKESV